MFGIDSCRVQMQSSFYLYISTNILWSNPKSLFVIKFNYDIRVRVLACLPLSYITVFIVVKGWETY